MSNGHYEHSEKIGIFIKCPMQYSMRVKIIDMVKMKTCPPSAQHSAQHDRTHMVYILYMLPYTFNYIYFLHTHTGIPKGICHTDPSPLMISSHTLGR